MQSIEIEAAQQKLDALLDDVERGKTIMLTRDTIVVARLIPIESDVTEVDAPPQKT